MPAWCAQATPNGRIVTAACRNSADHTYAMGALQCVDVPSVVAQVHGVPYYVVQDERLPLAAVSVVSPDTCQPLMV